MEIITKMVKSLFIKKIIIKYYHYSKALLYYEFTCEESEYLLLLNLEILGQPPKIIFLYLNHNNSSIRNILVTLLVKCIYFSYILSF